MKTRKGVLGVRRLSRLTPTEDFGHANIIKYTHRPFLSERDKEELAKTGMWHDGNWKGEGSSKWRMTDEAIELMDQTLIKEINDLVGPDDILYHLGDWAMPNRKHDYYKRCRYYRDQIKCRNVHLIWGNHDDHCIADLFNSAQDMGTIYTSKYRVILNHYAMAVWNGSHRGNLHLYGHSHAGAEPWLDRTMPGRKSMDVGVDNVARLYGAYRPLTLDEIEDRLVNRAGFAFDHHVGKIANTPREEDLQELKGEVEERKGLDLEKAILDSVRTSPIYKWEDVEDILFGPCQSDKQGEMPPGFYT